MDNNLTQENLDLVIIGPVWTNHNDIETNITLAGNLTSLNKFPKAASGGTGQPGSSGCTGVSGDPGGTIFGISGIIESSNPVKIISQGGKGGQGQEGGDGGVGVSGRNAQMSDYGDRANWFIRGCFIIATEHYGFSGFNGKSGGDGGKRGIGGRPVETQNHSLVVLHNSGTVNFVSLEGPEGLPGMGGNGGSGGRAGQGNYCETRNIFDCTYKSLRATRSCELRQAQCNKGRCPGNMGQPGRNGISPLCPSEPKAPTRKLISWPALVQYRKNFFNYTHSITTTFFTELDKQAESNDIFTLKALAEETLTLESFSRNGEYLKRLREMYLSLIFRLENFFDASYDTLLNEHKKIINILLSFGYSSLPNLDTSQNYDVIVDITYYFSSVVQQINSLRYTTTLNAVRQKMDFATVNSQEKVYQALGFIEQTITPAIYETKQNLQVKVDVFEKHLISLIEDTELSFEDMKQNIRTTNVQETLNFLKIFGVVLNVTSVVIPITDFPTFGSLIQQLEEKFSGKQESLQRLEQLAEECELLVKELEEERVKFQNELQSFVDYLFKYFHTIRDSFNSGNGIEKPKEIFNKRLVMTQLKKVSYTLDVFADANVNSLSLTHTINRIKNAMTMAIDLYEMIEDYLDTTSFANHISMINLDPLAPILITDPEYIHTVENFDTKFRENLLDIEVKKAYHAFKQWVFPFAKFYFGGKSRYFVKQNVSSEIGAEHSQAMENIQIDLERYKAMTVGNLDTLIILSNFSSGLKVKHFIKNILFCLCIIFIVNLLHVLFLSD